MRLAHKGGIASGLTLCLLFYLTAGCATTPPIPDITKISPAQVQAKISRNFSKLDSFEGRARVIIELPGEGYNGTARVFINLPDSVFVKTEAILGIDIGALFMDARYFGAYAPRENVLYYGETDILDLQDFLQVEIETDDLVEVLTGLAQVNLDSTVTFDYEAEQLVVTRRVSDGGKLKLWIDARKYVVIRSELTNARGEITLLKEYSRFDTEKGIVLPQLIKITRPQARERLTVYYTNQKINQSIDPQAFRLKTAKNAKRVYWGDIVQPAVQRQRPNK